MPERAPVQQAPDWSQVQAGATGRPQVALREVQDEDLLALHEFEQDEQACQLAHFAARDRERFLHHWRTSVLGDPDVIVRAVTLDGVLAGSVVSWTQGDRRFLGYWLGRAFWGRGVGTRAVTDFLAVEAHRPLFADPHGGNLASVALLRRTGFREVADPRAAEGGFVLLRLD